MRPGARAALAFLYALVITACYRPTPSPCAVECGGGGACPSGLSCDRGYCFAAGASRACLDELTDASTDGAETDAADGSDGGGPDAAQAAGRFPILATGNRHTCGIDAAGALYCWGNNASTELGVGAPSRIPMPQRVGTLTGWTEVATGYAHTCAIRGGDMVCFGASSSGQCGLTATTSNPRTIPRPDGAGMWIAVAVGDEFSCGLFELTATVTAYCWGANAQRQLGDGTNSPRPTAMPVEDGADLPLTGWTALAAGGRHACGVRGGVIECWGQNSGGQLGRGGETTSEGVPNAVAPAVTTPRALTAGDNFTCATDANRDLYCWGQNDAGQIGLDTTPEVASPTKVPTESGVMAVDGGLLSTCVTTATTVRCTGDGNLGALGDDTWALRRTFAPILGVGAVSRISVGNHTACATGAASTICWGRNSDGQLGNGVVANKFTPVQIGGAARWRAVGAGKHHTCAIRIDADSAGTPDEDDLYCWGWNKRNELGDTGPDTATPRLIDGTRIWQDVDGGDSFACGVNGAAGSQVVSCWGDNGDHRTGFNSNVGTTVAPTDLALPPTMSPSWTISIGDHRGCAVRTGDARRWCWGENSGGYPIVNGTAGVIPGATDMSDTNWGEIALGLDFGLAAQAAASTPVRIWGRDGVGQTGLGGAGVMDQLNLMSLGVVPQAGTQTLAAGLGGRHACIVRATSALVCWGFNAYGQVGDNVSLQNREFPIDVDTTGVNGTWQRVSAGENFTCATTTQALYCWGENNDGQLGNNETSPPQQRDEPRLASTASWKALSAGYDHACAIDASDHLWCWGGNIHGEIGDGSHYAGTPVDVRAP